MACISRIIRHLQLRTTVPCFARNLISHNAPLISQAPQIPLAQNSWIWRQNDKVELPVTKKMYIDLPNGLRWVPPAEDPKPQQAIDLPAIPGSDNNKEAAKLIVIRRAKMRKHKLKKLRKKMKFEWAKRRQIRELKKEKAFQAVLIKQCKEAEAFSAEKYVEERLSKFTKATQSQDVEPQSRRN